jgi:hypothetical protein
MDPLEQIKEIVEKQSQVKLGAGVMGKTGTVILALVPVWMVALARIGENLYLNISLIAAATAITCVAIWWVRRLLKFADKNPGAALLEGAEFVAYERWQAEVKGRRLPRGPVIPNPHVPPERQIEDQQ